MEASSPDKESPALHDNVPTEVLLKLSGAERAAAILVAIGRPSAAQLLKHFNSDDLRKLAGHAKTLKPLSSLEFEQLVKQFENMFAEGEPVSEAGQRFEGLVREALSGDEADTVLRTSRDLALNEPIWPHLAQMPLDVLLSYLREQHPQIIAFIVSKLPADIAARIFLGIPSSQRSSVVLRSLHIGHVSSSSVALLENVLRTELLLQQTNVSKANHSQIANIFNQLDQDEMKQLLASLDELDEDDLKQIKAKLFTFNDILQLDPRARLLLFDEVPTDQLVTALRESDPQIQDTILSSLSVRNRRIVEAELSSTGYTSAASISDARQSIVRVAIELSDRGIIKLSTSD